MTTFDSVTDSGERRDFGTGSVRDQSEGKGRYDLLEPYAIKRLAQHFENGAKKYGDNNWKLGQPLSVYLDSGIRHGFNLLEGQTNEDHAAAMAWNAMAFISTKHWIDEGKLPKELDDIDWDVVPEEAPEQIMRRTFIPDASKISFSFDGIPEGILEAFTGSVTFEQIDDAPITMGGPVDDDEPEEFVFEVGDRVQHRSCGTGTVVALDDRVGGDIAIHWDSDSVPVLAGHTVGSARENLVLVERPERPTGRVSVRKITKALKPVKFIPEEPLYSRHGRIVEDLTLEDSEIIQILDALEDAGYEVTYAPKA